MADLTKIYSFSCIVSDGRSYLNIVQQHLLDLRIFHRTESYQFVPILLTLPIFYGGRKEAKQAALISMKHSHFYRRLQQYSTELARLSRFLSLYRWLPKQKTSYRQRLLRWKPEFDGSTNQQKMGYYIAVFECKISTNSTGR